MSVREPEIFPTLHESFDRVADKTLMRRAQSFVDFVVAKLPKDISIDPETVRDVKDRVFAKWQSDDGYQKYRPVLETSFIQGGITASFNDEAHWMERLNISLFNLVSDMLSKGDIALGNQINMAFKRDDIVSFPKDQEQRTYLSPVLQTYLDRQMHMPSA